MSDDRLKSACESRAKLESQWREYKDSVKGVSEAIVGIKFGLITQNLLNLVQASVASLVNSLTSAGTAYATAVAGAWIQAFLSLVLAIVKEFHLVFSIAATPHRIALASARKERAKLSDAITKINAISMFLIKWSNKFKGRDVEALSEEVRGLLGELETYIEDPGDDSTYFRGVLFRVNQLVDRTDTDSVSPIIVSEASRDIEAEASIIYNSRVIEKYGKPYANHLDEWHKASRSRVIDKYNDRYKGGAVKFNPAADAAFIAEMATVSAHKKTREQNYRKACLNLAIRDKEARGSGFRNIKEELQRDVDRLKVILGPRSLSAGILLMSSELAEALLYYNQSHSATRLAINAEEVFQRILDAANDLLGKASEAASDKLQKALSPLRKAVDRCIALMTFDDRSQLAIARITLVHNIMLANQSLYEVVLSRESLSVLDQSKRFELEKERYEEFVGRVKSIPGWEEAAWVDEEQGVVGNPYLLIPVDMSKLAIQVSGAVLTGNMTEALKQAETLRLSMSRVYSHNSEVISTLSSYTPTQSMIGNELMRLLSSIPSGLLSVLGGAAIVSNLALLARELNLTKGDRCSDVDLDSEVKIELEPDSMFEFPAGFAKAQEVDATEYAERMRAKSTINEMQENTFDLSKVGGGDGN